MLLKLSTPIKVKTHQLPRRRRRLPPKKILNLRKRSRRKRETRKTKRRKKRRKKRNLKKLKNLIPIAIELIK
tara:strand:+ start:337 stop:552 length:216 start_codon:yes stop_codon:yes gene_type:complete